MGSDSVEHSLFELAASIQPGATFESTVSDILSSYQSHVDCIAAGLAKGNIDTHTPIILWESDEVYGVDDINSVQSFMSLSESNADFDQQEDIDSAIEMQLRDRNLTGYVFSVGDFGYLCVIADGEFSEPNLSQLGKIHSQIGSVCSSISDNIDSPSVDPEIFSNGGIDITSSFQSQFSNSTGHMLDFLTEYSSRMLSASTREDVSEQLVTAIDRAVVPDVVCMYLYNRGEDIFERVVSMDDNGVFEDEYSSESLVGEVLGGQVATFDDFTADASLTHYRNIGGCMLYPVGEYGVLIAANEEPSSFAPDDIRVGSFFTRIANHVFNQLRLTHGLRSVNEFAEDVSGATSRDIVTDSGVEFIENTLDFPLTAIWEYNPITNMLQPATQSDRSAELVGELPTFGQSNSIAWSVFQNSELEVVQDTSKRSQTNDPTIQSEVLLPIGDYGVLATGALQQSNINQVDKEVAKALSSTMESAIESAKIRGQVDLLENTVFRALRHNIRNDINVVDGFLEILEPEIDDTQRLETIQEKVDSVENVVENARLLRRVIQHQDERTTMEADVIVDEALSYVSETPDDFDINIIVECDDLIVGHPQLPDAVGHLLQNAVEHASDEATVVRLSIRSGDDMAIIAVADNGQGIPPNEIAVLGDEESVLEHGSGLGLWVADRIVENSDGRLSVYNSNGTTAEITVDIDSSGE